MLKVNKLKIIWQSSSSTSNSNSNSSCVEEEVEEAVAATCDCYKNSTRGREKSSALASDVIH